jgi:hypothetical protein
MSELKEIPVWAIVIIVPILLFQGTWMFLDARRCGKWRWFWGLWGLTSIPTPILVYLFFIRFPDDRKKKSNLRKDD